MFLCSKVIFFFIHIRHFILKNFIHSIRFNASRNYLVLLINRSITLFFLTFSISTLHAFFNRYYVTYDSNIILRIVHTICSVSNRILFLQTFRLDPNIVRAHKAVYLAFVYLRRLQYRHVRRVIIIMTMFSNTPKK